ADIADGSVDPHALAAIRTHGAVVIRGVFDARQASDWNVRNIEHTAGDGTLQLIPVANAMAYVVLRALQDDVADDDLCGARPGRALSIRPEWHALLLDALVP
ncbi:YbiU family protein, partial [Burkholderia cenocepacia]|uniref:YbiU family protein n=1 Tax=Burkholderia cenocepacia TaxID=95486 RepID=UPI0024B773AE